MRKWTGDLWLFTLSEFEQLPNGFEVTSIGGEKKIKGKDYIDDDTRFGYMAYGVIDPMNHPDAELFVTFKLKGF